MAYPILPDGLAAALPPVIALLAIAFGAFLAWRVAQVKVRSGGSAAGRDAGREYLLEEEARGEDEVRFCSVRWGCFLGRGGGGEGERPIRPDGQRRRRHLVASVIIVAVRRCRRSRFRLASSLSLSSPPSPLFIAPFSASA